MEVASHGATTQSAEGGHDALSTPCPPCLPCLPCLARHRGCALGWHGFYALGKRGWCMHPDRPVGICLGPGCMKGPLLARLSLSWELGCKAEGPVGYQPFNNWSADQQQRPPFKADSIPTLLCRCGPHMHSLTGTDTRLPRLRRGERLGATDIAWTGVNRRHSHHKRRPAVSIDR